MKRFVAIVATLALPACGSSGISPTSPASSSAVASTGSHRTTAPLLRRGVSPITHVIIVIQENRSTDNLFQGLPGADTQSYGLDSYGNQVPLHSTPLEWDGDISHSHTNFVNECNPIPSNLAVCQMNGWNHAQANSPDCPVSGDDYCPYAYVPRSESQPYFDMAAEFAFGDRMFETNEGPSFPAHQELISGTASSAPQLPLRQISANPKPKHSGGGCDSAPGTTVDTIPLKPIGAGEGKPQFPCFDRPDAGRSPDRCERFMALLPVRHRCGPVACIQRHPTHLERRQLFHPRNTSAAADSNRYQQQLAGGRFVGDAGQGRIAIIPASVIAAAPHGWPRSSTPSDRVRIGIRPLLSSLGTIGADGTTTSLLIAATTTTWGFACLSCSFRRMSSNPATSRT